MNLLKKIIFFIVLLLQTIANAQSSLATSYEVKLVFHTIVGDQPLQLNSNYITPLSDTFSITKFKYFIGNITFIDESHGVASQTFKTYILIDQSDTLSQIISLGGLQNNHFNSLQFIIGIDSANNVSGTQTGALDPATGMFWTWNSGYIMAKLEGKSPQSKAPFGNITYHIGGFRQKDNAIRIISLPITKWPKANNSSSVIQIDINVDLNKWFDGPHPIKIADKSFCMSPGKMAIEIADNYANMFSIKSISVK